MIEAHTNKRMHSIIAKLPRLLTWRHHKHFFQTLFAESEKRLKELFDHWLMSIYDSRLPRAEEVTDCFGILPEESRLRFCAAPATCAMLSKPFEEHNQAELNFVQRSLLAEMCRANLQFLSPVPLWTALGDC